MCLQILCVSQPLKTIGKDFPQLINLISLCIFCRQYCKRHCTNFLLKFHNSQNNHNWLKPWAKTQLHQYRENKYGPKSIPDPGDPLYIFYIVLGIIGSIFGYDRYDAGGPGMSIDWTIFFAIASLVVALTGFILLLAMKSATGTLALWAMIKFFTIIGLPLSVIGYIKSVNQYY